MSAPFAPPDRPRRRRSLRRTILAVAGAILVLIVALALFPGLFLGRVVARRIVAALESRTNARAEVGGVGLGLSSGATVRDLRLYDRSAPRGAPPVAVAKRLHVGLALRPLLSKEAELRDVTLEGVEVRAERRRDGSIDLLPLLRPPAKEAPRMKSAAAIGVVPAPVTAREPAPELQFSVRLPNGARADDVRILLHDEASGATFAAERLTLELGPLAIGRDLTLGGPVKLEGRAALDLAGRPGTLALAAEAHLPEGKTLADPRALAIDAWLDLAADAGAPAARAALGLPEDAVLDGALRLHARAGGTLAAATAEVALDLRDAAVLYAKELRKPAGVPAQATLRASWREGDLAIEPGSELRLGGAALALAGGTAGELSRATVAVRSNEIDLATLGPLFPSLEKLAGRATLTGVTTADLAAIRAGAKPLLPHIRGEAQLTAPALAVGSLEIGALRANLAAKDGKLTLDARDVALLGGAATVHAAADLTGALPALETTAQARALGMTPEVLRGARFASPVFVFVNDPAAVRGTLGLDLHLTARGASAAAALETLSGDGSIGLAGGGLSGAELSRSLAQASGGALLLPAGLDIGTFEHKFHIDAGRILNPGVSLALGPDVRLSLAGATGVDGTLDHELALAGPGGVLAKAVRGPLGDLAARAARPLLRFHLGGSVTEPVLGAPSIADAARGVEEGILRGGLERGREELEKRVPFPVPGIGDKKDKKQ